MKKFRGFTIIVTVSVLIATAAVYSSQIRTSQDSVLTRQVTNISLENITIRDTLARALFSADAAGGIAVVQNCDESAKYTLTPADNSLRAILESIVAVNPQYKWEITNGIINLLPNNSSVSFLDVRIANLQINEAATPNEALNQLLALPEVQKEAEFTLGARVMQGGTYPFDSNPQQAKDGKKISIKLKNTTVRGALNAIALEHGSAIWMLTQGQCNGRRLFSLDFVAKG